VTDTFPRQYARTQRMSLGEPRTFTVSPDGQRVVFVRSRGGNDRVNCLWVLDVATGEERLIADPLVLLADATDEQLPPEERARRERAREGAAGVVAYATNADVTAAAFSLGGRLFLSGLITGASRELHIGEAVFDPRPDPQGRRVAFVSGPRLQVAELDGTARVLADEPDDEVTWGAADFIAGEEMNRQRGYWWSPDGTMIAACRVDNSPVQRWWIADPSDPASTPRPHAYPAAGTDNPRVELFVITLDGDRRQVVWDVASFPYLARVSWAGSTELFLSVQSRDQRTLAMLSANPTTGATSELWRDEDDAWVELVDGGPGRLGDGRLVTCADRDGARRVLVDGAPVTPLDVQVRSIIHIGAERVGFVGNPIDSPEVAHLYVWSASGIDQLTSGVAMHSGVIGGSTVLVRRASLDAERATFTVIGGPSIRSFSEAPLVTPAPTLLRLGPRRVPTAVLFPTGHAPGERLPVLLDPYGGPHAQRVVASRTAHATSQWFADQGFAVVVIDGRGTPGLGSAWERDVHLDLAQPVLDDQVDGLLAAAELYPDLDLSRVAIRGWSFGGYLAALAVLRRPDVFHAAVAGAPVTEWRLYDTHYTERYLGDPNLDPACYDRSSLLVDAAKLTRPLLLIHGLADDNVVSAHTLQMSSALLAAGRPHEVLPLSGVSHMTPQEVVAENTLLLQLDFIRRALGLGTGAIRLDEQ
jgi:dipeptidyl-peptidase 4